MQLQKGNQHFAPCCPFLVCFCCFRFVCTPNTNAFAGSANWSHVIGPLRLHKGLARAHGYR